MNRDIVLELDDMRVPQWSGEFVRGSYGDIMTVTRIGSHQPRAAFRIDKGLKDLNVYAELRKTFEAYRDFMSNPIVLQAG